MACLFWCTSVPSGPHFPVLFHSTETDRMKLTRKKHARKSSRVTGVAPAYHLLLSKLMTSASPSFCSRGCGERGWVWKLIREPPALDYSETFTPFRFKRDLLSITGMAEKDSAEVWFIKSAAVDSPHETRGRPASLRLTRLINYQRRKAYSLQERRSRKQSLS